MPFSTRSLLAIVMLLLGSSVFSGHEAHADEVEAAPEERVVFVLAELATSLDAAGEECDRVAVVVRDWTAAHSAELPALAKETDARVGTLGPAASQRFDASIATSMESIFTAAMVCSEHAETGDALDALDRVMRGEAVDK